MLVTHLGDGEVESDVDDDGEEEQVEGADDQQGLLQEHHLLERVLQLKRQISFL